MVTAAAATSVYIGIGGAHSTGKTTLAKRIEMELRGDGYAVTRIGGLAKRAVELGFPKMTRHTAASTEWIISAGAAAALEAGLGFEVVIVDRAAPDAVAYYLAALEHRGESGDPRQIGRLTRLASTIVEPYVLNLVTVLDPGARMNTVVGKDKDPAYFDLDYRTAIDKHHRAVIDELGLPHTLVHRGMQAEAVETAVAAIRARLGGDA